MSGDIALIVVAALLLLFAALLSGIETAFARVSRVLCAQLVEEGKKNARRLAVVVDSSGRALGGVVLLRVVCQVGLAAIVAILLSHHLGRGFASVGVTAAAVGFVMFAVVEVGPRTLGRQQAVPFALGTAGFVLLLSRLLGPVAHVLVMVGNAVTPGPGLPDGPFASEAELRGMVEEAERTGVVDSSAGDMLTGVFELGDTLAREVMVPRTEIVFIERDKTVRQALSLALRSGFSRLPVVGDDIDDIVGVVMLKDLVRKAFDGRSTGRTAPLKSLIRPVPHVPDSKVVDELLREMQAARTHFAVVVDEYGGTAGILTIEDILEEIVGEISDEYDDDAAPVQELEDGSLRVTSRLLIEEVEDLCDVTLPHDDGVETISGLMADALGRVPIPGATVEVGGLRLTAEHATGRRNRIDTIRIERLVEDKTVGGKA
ncbi:MAG TPA: hemolysin family protein [Mycobacteriales bacterium]|nr:hemolysin family protein [Mycobacteriales bacterium]